MEPNQRRGSSSLAAALQRYLHSRSAAMIDARRELRINDLDARALLYVADHPGTRPGALSAFLGITSAGVTTLIDRLVKRGAVRRDVDPDDRRVNRLTATVDLSAAPWSALTRFDEAFHLATTEAGDPHLIEQLVAALDDCTNAAAEASARPPRF
ncbi:MAG TPA: helix-turn-helix domain-containing protein [Microbacterium sp.]|uniref:MarR family transcriptional regulator n=1 Tax=Microbacterium sp. TaxID=51671 RepID=UPI002B493A19|nr:helix-turn-helix domain-containing protein [Microbacterium sp.]HKT57661.1 helix-turn-helix domain-containing protein [Microbacterium sp.]